MRLHKEFYSNILSFACLLTYLLLMYIGHAKPTIEKTNDPEIEYTILELEKSNKRWLTLSLSPIIVVKVTKFKKTNFRRLSLGFHLFLLNFHKRNKLKSTL